MTKPEAVIEIGSAGIRLLVVQVQDNDNWEVIDYSEVAVPLGKDVFTTGSISHESLLLCIKVLNRFKEQLASWQIDLAQVFVIATSSFREAKNSDPIVDRIFVSTGFKIKVIDGLEENRLMYLAVTKKIKSYTPKNLKEDAIILEVGGGSTEMMLIKQGKIAGAHSLKLGTIRIEQNFNLPSITADDIQKYIRQYILNTKGALNEELDLSCVKHFYTAGIEPKIACKHYGKEVTKGIYEISRKDFHKFVKEVQYFSQEEIAAKYNLEYVESHLFLIGLSIYDMFIGLTNIEKIVVLDTNIRDGIIISRFANTTSEISSDFNLQISASAISLLNKYHGDVNHALFVRKISLDIFDSLQEETGLDSRARLLLDVASILHDIGMFIKFSDHHLHSKYIIQNSEIFGLKKYESNIVSLIAKYHRGSVFPTDDEQFMILPRNDRMTILKLTSILRIADALDRGHLQKFKNLVITRQNDTLLISDKNEHNLVLEKQALTEKANMFEYVFGYKLVLS